MAASNYVYRLTLAPGQRVRVHTEDPRREEMGAPLGPTLHFDPDRQSALAAQVRQVVSGPAPPTPAEIRALGHALAALLFDGELRVHLLKIYNLVEGEGKALLRIELEEPAGNTAADKALAHLPWEFLCVPYRADQGQDIFLGAQPRVVLARRPAGWKALEPILLEADEKLRIAVAVADPEAEIEPLRRRVEALAEQTAVFAPPDIRRVRTRQEIDRLLEEAEPHLFHFTGATRANEDGEAEVTLTAADGTVRGFSPAQFAGLLRRHLPAVALFQPGSAANNRAPGALLALGRAAASLNVPVTVAMQHAIRPDEGYGFADEFYRRLGRLEPVDKAVLEARYQMADLYESAKFGSPVLFMRVRDGHLFSWKEEPAVAVGPPPLAEKLRQSLMQLDYAPQWQQFNETALGHANQVGAVLITGRPRTGKRWLLSRLAQTVHPEWDPVTEKIIQLDLYRIDPTVDGLWSEVALATGLSPGSQPAAIVKQLLQLRETQHLFLVLENVGDDPVLLEEILAHFWQPLATAARAQAGANWLLLFLLDNVGLLSGREVAGVGAERPLFAQLPPTPERFPPGTLGAWLSNPATLQVPPLFRRRQQVQQQIPGWESDMYPLMTLKAICELCDLKWETVAGRWLKI